MATAFDVQDVINPASTLLGDDAELLRLTLLTSLDGRRWHPKAFEGESAAFVDMAAVMFIHEYRSSLGIGFDENNDWSLFPNTFDALFALASTRHEPQLNLAYAHS